MGRNWYGETMPGHLSEEQIARYRERRTPPEQFLQVDDHVSQCAECRERLASANDLRAGLQRTDVASQGEHLAYEQLEAYVDGKMSEADRELAQTHLESCPTCSADVRDLQTFKAELAGPKDQSKGGWWSAFVAMWLTRRRVAFAVTMAAVIVLAVELGKRQMGPPHGIPSSGTANSTRTETLLAIKTMSPEEQAAVLEAISQQNIKTPVVLVGLRGPKETLLSESHEGARFEVLQPLGEVVLDARPLFRWQPLAGAISYSVAIFDPHLNPVQSSPALGTTQWSAAKPLPRGQTYLWQVTAKLSNGQMVSSPRPPNPEARFRVLDQTKADELSQFQAAHPEAHLALGILYAEAGMLEQAGHELGQLAKSDPDYDLAQKLLKSIQEIRHPTH
jgi:hypothetical protein